MLKRIVLGAVLTLLLVNTVTSSGSWIRYPENPVLEQGPSGSWDALGVRAPCVLKDNGAYMMWYNSEYHVDGHDYIGLATSPDGTTWEKHAGNPVLSPESSWEWGRIMGPSVIKDDGIYKMWYTGREGIGTGHSRIGYATSDDGINWNKYSGNPILDIGSPGQWDDDLVGNPCVIKDGGVYKMWYTGRYSGGGNRIGYATSSDGVSWDKHLGNPVLDIGLPGEIDSIGVAHPAVIKENGRYHMWYTAVKDNPERTQTIAYASSMNGIDWTKAPDNPVLEPDPESSWESKDIAVGQVIKDDEKFKMWYTGRASSQGAMSVGYAEYIAEISLSATINVDPDTLNLKSKGRWITAYIELPEGYDVSEFDVSTVMLNSEIPAELHPTEIGDYDTDGIPDLMVKFDRQETIALLSIGEATLTITGKVNDALFEGSDTIRVIDK